MSLTINRTPAQAPPPPEPPAEAPTMLLARKDVCRELRISTATLHRLRTGSQFPEPIELGAGYPRWTRESIEQWIRTRRTA